MHYIPTDAIPNIAHKFYLTTMAAMLFLVSIIGSAVLANAEVLRFKGVGYVYPDAPKINILLDGKTVQSVTVNSKYWKNYSVNLPNNEGEEFTIQMAGKSLVALRDVTLNNKAVNIRRAKFTGCRRNTSIGNSVLLMLCPGMATIPPKTPNIMAANTMKLAITASGIQHEGAPRMVVLSGLRVVYDGRITADYTQGMSDLIEVTIPKSVNRNRLSIAFVNDYLSDTGDRNLIIQDITLDGESIDLRYNTEPNNSCLNVHNVGDAHHMGMWCNMVVQFNMNNGKVVAPDHLELSQKTQAILVQASATPYKGPAQLRLHVNGKLVEEVSVSSDVLKNEQQELRFMIPAEQDIRTLRLSFVNDLLEGPGKDRNLYIHKVLLGETPVTLKEFNLLNGCATYRASTPPRVDMYCNGAVVATFQGSRQLFATKRLKGLTPIVVATPTPAPNQPVNPGTPVLPPVATGAVSCSCEGDLATPNMQAANIASYRFGFGPKDNAELRTIASNPRCWLKKQICNAANHQLPRNLAAFPDTMQIQYYYNISDKDTRDAAVTVNTTRSDIANKKISARNIMPYEVNERMATVIETNAPFVERWVHFWNNHFTVASVDGRIASLVGAYERDVVRKHLFGNIGDMALAMAKHPAMLMYLNNDRNAKNNLNENFAREILELYCLGVDAPYNENDIRETAKILSGWRFETRPKSLPAKGADGFKFQENLHEPGNKTVMGRTYGEGLAAGEQFVKDLCTSNYAATFMAKKLATHFISDTPPQSAINKLAAAFAESGGNLQTVALTLADMPEAWGSAKNKFSTPDYFLLSTFRLLVKTSDHLKKAFDDYDNYSDTLNQAPWEAPFPEGWCDKQECWLSGQSLSDRLNVALTIVSKIGTDDILQELFANALGTGFSIDQLNQFEMTNPATCDALDTGPLIKPCTLRAVVAADSQRDAYAIFLNSPDRLYR